MPLEKSGETDKGIGVSSLSLAVNKSLLFSRKGKGGSYLRRALPSEVAEEVLRRYPRHVAGLVVV